MQPSLSGQENSSSGVSFGFDGFLDNFGAEGKSPVAAGSRNVAQHPVSKIERNLGLGKGLGGQLMRSALGATAYAVLDPIEKARQQRYQLRAEVMHSRKLTLLPPETPKVDTVAQELPEASQASPNASPASWASVQDIVEPQGMFKALLLGDQAWAAESATSEDLEFVRQHRWKFNGALELAQRGRSFCFFVRCLLEMQLNLQCEEEGDILEPVTVRACSTFVQGHCFAGRANDMYQLLTHFISNAVIFNEWHTYLKTALDSPRANQEAFLVPHLEQVWSRLCRILRFLEDVFGLLDSRFADGHGLPKVVDLIRLHMQRCCLTREMVHNNAIFLQEKCPNEVVRNVKHFFRFEF